MNAARAARSPARLLCALTLASVCVLGTACYSKVVDAKGLGGDSTQLRKNHEFGTDEPFGLRVRKEPPKR